MSSSSSTVFCERESARLSSITSLREKLVLLFNKVKLPSSPALATKILELTEDPDASAEDFAKLIQMDGALSARLLKMSNAASLGQRTPVTTVHKAVTVLGLARVKTAALGFQLVGHLNKLGKCPFDMTRYWQHAVLRGCVAREMARAIVPKRAEEAFLVGLLQDTGILLLVQILGEPYADLYKSHANSHAGFHAAERASQPHSHVDASAAMAQEWKLPDVIAYPIANHHAAPALPSNATEQDRLASVAYLVASMRFAQQTGEDQNDQATRDYATNTLNLTDPVLQRAFADAAKCYEQMAELLGDALPEDVDVTELLSQANSQLTTVAGQAEEKITTAAAERQELEAKQAELTNVLGEVTKRAYSDPLTGALNRGALTEAAMARVEKAKKTQTTISVAFLDVDNFKKLNDTYGHKTGDEVLKAVAESISAIGKESGCSGRYGGEEFVVVVPGLDGGGARQLGEAVCNAIRGINYRALKLSAAVTASVGVAFGIPEATATVEDLFAAADRWLYQAKKSGKDRFVLGNMSPPAASNAATSAVSVKPEAIKAVAVQMNSTEAPVATNVRREAREKVAMACKVATFNESLQIRMETGCVRNLSSGGMNLLVSSPIAIGKPIEAAIQLPNKSTIHMAGVVVHHRKVQDHVHEIGVKVSTTSRQPVFAANPMAALVGLPWLAQALQIGTGTK